MLLNEELARAILVSDGRDPVTQVNDHINTTNIRPIWGDDAIYAYHYLATFADTIDDLIDAIITAQDQYEGSGNPVMFCAQGFLTSMLLLRDSQNHRMYRSKAELADELQVSDIIPVPIMTGLNRTVEAVVRNLRAIIVNLGDYTAGADKGGEINFFDDFDIDYNQYKYLLETRMSGALVVPKSAIVIEQLAA
jgi:hypothetical protein